MMMKMLLLFLHSMAHGAIGTFGATLLTSTSRVDVVFKHFQLCSCSVIPISTPQRLLFSRLHDLQPPSQIVTRQIQCSDCGFREQCLQIHRLVINDLFAGQPKLLLLNHITTQQLFCFLACW
jgi:hypothetical protein